MDNVNSIYDLSNLDGDYRAGNGVDQGRDSNIIDVRLQSERNYVGEDDLHTTNIYFGVDICIDRVVNIHKVSVCKVHNDHNNVSNLDRHDDLGYRQNFVRQILKGIELSVLDEAPDVDDVYAT